MPKALLLSRETLANHSLTTIVEKSQTRKPPLAEYDLRLNSTQLDLVLVSKPPAYIKPLATDEGFESDIDTLSLVSSDDSFTSSTCLVDDHVLKHRENDSANGSASSDSDTEIVVDPTTASSSTERQQQQQQDCENYQLVDVLCYTDVKFPRVLVFVIKESVLVFNFDNVEHLQTFYTSFNTLKAVTNQRTYGRNLGAKFNLLQRTDNNGVTHIEISREPGTKLQLPESSSSEPSSIISINTPESRPRNDERKLMKLKSADDSKVMLQNELRSARNDFYHPNQMKINSFTLKPKLSHENRSISKDNILDSKLDESLKKVWKSAEDLLDVPKRPERRRKQKGRAPPPPVDLKQNVMKGQFVRVAVDPKKPLEKFTRLEEPTPPNFQTFSPNVQTFTPNWNNIRQPQSPLILTTTTTKQSRQYPKLPEIIKRDPIPTAKPAQQSWTNSVPRLLRKPRSKSETRHQTPMAYRYIDTTKPQQFSTTNSQTISNRLFGLSQKLKEFGNNVVSTNSGRNFNFYETDGNPEIRRNSLGEMSYKVGGTESSLKSVIKKQDDHRKTRNGNEQKKVTFSAYATVQVV